MSLVKGNNMRSLFLTVCAMTLLTACKCGHQIDNSGTNVLTPTTSENMVFEKQLIQLGDRVFFAYNSANLTPESIEMLKKHVEFIKNNKNTLTYTIEGHCDERGTTEYNLALGEKRAYSVLKFFKSHGIDQSKVKIISYGKEKPVALGHDEESWKQNRRAVTVVN